MLFFPHFDDAFIHSRYLECVKFSSFLQTHEVQTLFFHPFLSHSSFEAPTLSTLNLVHIMSSAETMDFSLFLSLSGEYFIIAYGYSNPVPIGLEKLLKVK